jgi:26S proteasome regulatory subunit N11
MSQLFKLYYCFFFLLKKLKGLLELAKNYNKNVIDEEKLTPEELAKQNVGKLDPKKHLADDVERLMSDNIVQCLGTMLDFVVF